MFDSREANRAYYGHLRERFGRPPLTEREVGFVHAHPAPESVPFIFRKWPQDIEHVNAYRASLDYTPFLRQMDIEPDLLEFLAAVRPPLLTAISTNRTSTMAAVLDTFALRPHFDLVVTALDVEHPKPHPEALLKILAGLGVRAQEGIFVGDTQVDVDHAAAVGMPLIAFRSPGLTAAYHVSSFREVLTLPPFAAATRGARRVESGRPRARARRRG
jgi:HAD superfamily hydrolase (TIGR01509 family)